jgi:hypothetical protein
MVNEIAGINIQISSLFYTPKNRDYNQVQIKTQDYTTRPINHPADTSVYTTTDFPTLIQALNTPDFVADYINSKLQYLDTNNNALGYIAGIYKPIEVFTNGGGNNTEQMAFASYILQQHNYASNLVTFVTADITHSFCAFKDTNGKWNALDYGEPDGKTNGIILANADSEEQLIAKTVPTWLALEIKNPEDGSTIKHVDSMTKWMITDWFEKD